MRGFIRNLIFSLLLGTGAVHSAQWKVEPGLSLRAGYSDNVRLSSENEISSSSATLSPSAAFSVETPKSGLSGTLLFDFQRYRENSSLDNDNIRFRTDSFHLMERSRVGLNASIIKDTTLDSQLEDTGLIFERVERLQLSGGPSWSYSISERTQGSVAFSYADVQYIDANDSRFTDFNAQNGLVSLSRALDERITTTITLSLSRTDNDNGVTSSNANLQGGASWQFSETMSASLFVGARRTETDLSQNTLVPIFSGNTIIGFVPLNEKVTNSSSGSTFSATLNKGFLRGRIGISASRNISTSANGIPTEVSRLGFESRYSLTELLTASLSVQYSTSKRDTPSTVNVDREVYRIEPGVTWKFKNFWELSGSYKYTKQPSDKASAERIENAAYLTLTYRWPRIAVSR